MKLLTVLFGWIAYMNKANIAAAVAFTGSAILLPLFHVTLTVQDQLELSGFIGILLHQIVYWTPNGPKVPTGDFGVANGGPGITSPPPDDKGL